MSIKTYLNLAKTVATEAPNAMSSIASKVMKAKSMAGKSSFGAKAKAMTAAAAATGSALLGGDKQGLQFDELTRNTFEAKKAQMQRMYKK
jgi:hypothetical protein